MLGAQWEHMDEADVSAGEKRQLKASQQEGMYYLGFRDAMYTYLSLAPPLHHGTILHILGCRLATSLAYPTILMCGTSSNMYLAG